MFQSKSIIHSETKFYPNVKQYVFMFCFLLYQMMIIKGFIIILTFLNSNHVSGGVPSTDIEAE